MKSTALIIHHNHSDNLSVVRLLHPSITEGEATGSITARVQNSFKQLGSFLFFWHLSRRVHFIELI